MPPGEDIGGAAAAGLNDAAGQLAAVRQAVASHTVHLDPVAATALLSVLDELGIQVADLVSFSDRSMDHQLHFGHNWVGAIMDQRLRGAVNGRPDSLRPVLSLLREVLGEVTDTVRGAAGLAAAADDESAERLNRIGR
ncbi:MAG TPA: hypothetical protein VFW65_31270 [Pseudonocardiaceae bacterium]|nr:hypothetical protein [Pseudonocardiaceae bacterium]